MKPLKTLLLTRRIIAAAIAASGVCASGLASSAPNFAESRRGADKVLLVPARQEYPNVIASVGVKYSMIRQNGVVTNTTNGSKVAKPAVEQGSANSNLPKSKNEVAVETLGTVSTPNRKQFHLPEAEDEVLIVGQRNPVIKAGRR